MTDASLRIAIIGPGRMGRAIHTLAQAKRFAVVGLLGREDLQAHREETRHRLAAADVAVEFTTSQAAVSNIRMCLEAGCPVVTGTTGWRHRLASVRDLVAAHRGALLWAPNFSLGAVALELLATRAGELFRDAGSFDTHVVETHHSGKTDAPSGTALALETSFRRGLGRSSPITAIRTGYIPGTHEILIDGPYEQIILRHEARDRRVFAEGALRAATWLAGRTGFYTMRDFLGGPSE